MEQMRRLARTIGPLPKLATGLLLLVTLIATACAEDPTPIATPTPQPTPTPVDVAALITLLQETIETSVEEALRETASIVEEPVSKDVLQELVRDVVAASVATAPPSITREQVEEVVAKAVDDTIARAPSSLTSADVKQIVKKAVSAIPAPTPQPTATAAPTPTPRLLPLLITDSNGSQVIFGESPERIIAYDSAMVEILFALGEDDRIVGAHDFVSYPPETAEIPKVGSSFAINSEKIVELEPDLIYTFYGSSVPDLENLGATVLYLETPTDLEGISRQIRMWGRITQNTERAEEVTIAFEKRVEALKTKLASVAAGPRVFHDDSLFFTRGPGTLVGKVYSLLKAQNIAHDISLYGQLTPEVIVERDPEVIITTFPTRPQEFLDDPAFQNVTAIKDGRVYAVNADLISVAGPRFVEAIEEIARLIHPAIFQ